MVNYGLRHGTTQTISVASSSAAVSNAFGSGTHYVRVVSTTNCHITFAGSPTATTSIPLTSRSQEMPPNVVRRSIITYSFRKQRPHQFVQELTLCFV